MTDNVSVTIDGRSLEVPKGTLVIRAAEQLGIIIPRFCDHPLLEPVAACRQCLVEVEGQRKPMTACSTTCTPDMVVKTHLTSEMAKQGQEGQLEFLLINHPLDCPQCDKGGECPLQDQALAHGAPDSRFLDDKRRYTKSIPISAQILLDREKCVLCARCTRFSQEISEDPFIELFERGALEQVAIYEDEPYESYYSGNVVQICPVGALTSTSYRFSARPFDLRSADGICNQCANGCNLRIDVRRGEIQRQLARDNMAVNESWNCDKGRFGFEYVAHADRLREPLVRDALGVGRPTAWISALRKAAGGLQAALDAGGPSAVGVLTGGRITDEDAYAVSRFAREVLGTDNVDFRLAPRTDEERDVLAAVAGTVGPTYDDVEAARVVVVAGLETEEEAPILHLRLRKAVRASNQRIVVVGPVLGSLAGLAAHWIATEVGGEAEALRALTQPEGSGDTTLTEAADAIRAAGEQLVILAGERLARSPGALRAAAALATTRSGGFAWVPRRVNARGAVDAGLLPGLLPGGRPLANPGPVAQVWKRLPDAPGLDTRGMLEAAARGELKALYLIGVDPARDFEDPALAEQALERVDTLIVQDLLPTASHRHADVVFAAAASQERMGSFTTWEGRRQPFPAALPAQGLAQEDWDILRQLARAMGANLGWETAMDVRREAAPLMEPAGPSLAFASLRDQGAARGPAGSSALGHADGSARAPGGSSAASGALGDAQPAAEQGEYGVVVLDYLLGRGTMLLGASALLDTARPGTVWVHPEDAARAGLSAGDAVAVVGSAGRVELSARITDAVARGVVVVPRNSTDQPVPLAGRVRLETLAAVGGS
jgi:NADH-quinone oxidoreductase subunit G